jgi:16S rRNA (cytidine1402-2'-O)-methyltransferase
VHRVGETLVALGEHFGAARRAAVARELTKLHEQISTGSLGELASRLGDEIPLKGEFVIVVAGAEVAAQPDEQRARSIFALLSEELSPSKAVAMTAAITGMPRNAVYRLTRVRE